MKKSPKAAKRVLAKVLAQKDLAKVCGGDGDVIVTQGEIRRDITQASAGDIPPV
jgi:hypothetical protein